MYKVVQVDQYGKEYGKAQYTDSKASAAFIYGFSRGADRKETVTHKQAGSKAKHETLDIKTKLFYLDSNGTEQDITPNSQKGLKDALELEQGAGFGDVFKVD